MSLCRNVYECVSSLFYLFTASLTTVMLVFRTVTISDDDIKLGNYVLYRADRDSRGEGVATYISSTVVSELATPKENPLHFEVLFVKIILHKNKQIIIGNIYRPPKAPVESTKNIISTINSLDAHTEMIILGDFNNNWLAGSCRQDRNLFSSSNLTENYNRTYQIGF